MGIMTFKELEAAYTEGLITDEERISMDPTTSRWLREAIRAMADRDPLDMLNDVEVLQELAEARLNRVLGR